MKNSKTVKNGDSGAAIFWKVPFDCWGIIVQFLPKYDLLHKRAVFLLSKPLTEWIYKQAFVWRKLLKIHWPEQVRKNGQEKDREKSSNRRNVVIRQYCLRRGRYDGIHVDEFPNFQTRREVFDHKLDYWQRRNEGKKDEPGEKLTKFITEPYVGSISEYNTEGSRKNFFKFKEPPKEASFLKVNYFEHSSSAGGDDHKVACYETDIEAFYVLWLDDLQSFKIKIQYFSHSPGSEESQQDYDWWEDLNMTINGKLFFLSAKKQNFVYFNNDILVHLSSSGKLNTDKWKKKFRRVKRDVINDVFQELTKMLCAGCCRTHSLNFSLFGEEFTSSISRIERIDATFCHLIQPEKWTWNDISNVDREEIFNSNKNLLLRLTHLKELTFKDYSKIFDNPKHVVHPRIVYSLQERGISKELFASCKRLTKLSQVGVSFPSNLFEKNKSLKELDISYCLADWYPLKQCGVKNWGYSDLQYLKILVMNNCQKIRASELVHLKQLECLEMKNYGNKRCDDSISIKTLCCLPSLKHVNFLKSLTIDENSLAHFLTLVDRLESICFQGVFGNVENFGKHLANRMSIVFCCFCWEREIRKKHSRVHWSRCKSLEIIACGICHYVHLRNARYYRTSLQKCDSCEKLVCSSKDHGRDNCGFCGNECEVCGKFICDHCSGCCHLCSDSGYCENCLGVKCFSDNPDCFGGCCKRCAKVCETCGIKYCPCYETTEKCDPKSTKGHCYCKECHEK